MNSWGRGLVRGRTTVVAVLALVGAGLAGCGTDRGPYADVPQLEVAWTASFGEPRRFTEHTATEDLWIAFEAGSHRLLALTLADGSVAWTLPTQEPCGFSEVNADGLLAVRSGDRTNCDHLVLIDTTTGEEIWSADTGADQFNPVEAGGIGLSSKTVSASGTCGVDRWDVRTGKKLATINGSQRFEDLPGNCRGALTSTDLAIVVGPKALVGYDIDSGTKRWSREGKDPDIGSLHSTDPLVAEVQIDGVAGLRTIEPTSGELGPVIGRPKGSTMSPGPVSVVADKVVGSYRPGSRQDPDGTYEAAVRAWDPSSGKELASWPGGDHDDYLGARSKGIDVGREVRGGRSGSSAAYWVARADWSGKKARTVGWIDDDVTSPVVVGDLLIDTGYGELPDETQGHRAVAYRLPERTTGDPIPRPQRAEKVGWAKDDVRPDPTVDPCAEVSDETLRGIGFSALLDREVPLDCAWVLGSTTFTTHVSVATPDSQGDAIQNSQAALAAVRGRMKEPVELEGLGEEAWVESSAQVAGGPDETFEMGEPSASSTVIRVAVRQKNVVAYVALEDRPDPRGAMLPVAASDREASVVAALRDVVEAAGGQLDIPAEAGDGPVTRVPDTCETVAADVRKVLPGARATELTASGDERLGGCLWATRRGGYVDSHVLVVAYAVGASPLTGVSGAEAAKVVFADSRGELATSRADRSWDESAMAEDFTGGYIDASHFVARGDNVIIVVGIGLRDRDKAVAPVLAPRIGKRVMDAIRD